MDTTKISKTETLDIVNKNLNMKFKTKISNWNDGSEL